MKSHPDAASRLAAEVVTQLPVPSRLGLLRFERLNEASWALLYLDSGCEQQFGLPAQELCSLLDAPYASLMEPAARHQLHNSIAQQLAERRHYSVQYCLHTPRGSLTLMEVGEAFKQHSRHLLRGYLLVIREQGAPSPQTLELGQHSQTDELAFAGEPAQVLSNPQQRHSKSNSLHLFQRAVEQSSSAFILLDREGLVEYVNPSFTAITLYSSAEVQGRRLSEMPALENLGELLFDASSGMAEHNSWQGEFKSRRKNLEPYWGQLSLSKVHADDGSLTHYIGIYEDITASKQAQQHIERLAFRDNLTGLGNRYAFIRSLESHFNEHPGKPISLLLVDIDNFKRINDSMGHQTGDKLLVSLARRLRNTLHPRSVLARFASNEFAVLLEANQADSQLVAQKLLSTLEKPLFVDNQLISVTGSIGLACAPRHGDDPQTLMKHTGLALHKAKANGKNQLQVFTDTLNAEAHHKLFVESNLRRALMQNELEVFYQPKLCLKSGRLQGLEALLRWHHPDKGMISPEKFIGVAEETGLIIPIGKWVARQACRMSKQLIALGHTPLQMAINLSPKQFSDPDLVGEIAAILHEEQLDPALLELELTESLLLEATDDTRHQLSRLKSLGLTLAMDDFGTGYSSLSYLKKFPIDVIKIDRSFIKDIPENQDDMEITSAVIAMAHNLKLKVVAEGIETIAQLNVLRRQHCDIGQGYLFDKPIASRDLLERLKRYRVRC
jgi:diguanylate cyclase (GGDEF)-like protein/PAS domain S-box-containing protein